MVIKLPILVCAEKVENNFSLPHQNQELKPMSRVETENSSISQGSQSGVTAMMLMSECPNVRN